MIAFGFSGCDGSDDTSDADTEETDALSEDVRMDDVRRDDVQSGDADADDLPAGECGEPCDEDIDCGDGNRCTEDMCLPATSCCLHVTATRDFMECDDGNECNGRDSCLGGECLSENPDNCGPCAEDSDWDCECEPFPEGTSCDDGLYCTGEDNACDGEGSCVHVSPCPEHENFCMMYYCYEDEPHCLEGPKADGGECGEADLCGSFKICWGGECLAVSPSCVDHDPCTGDVCDPETGDCETPAPPILDCGYCEEPGTCDDGNDCSQDYCRMIGEELECEYILGPECIPEE